MQTVTYSSLVRSICHYLGWGQANLSSEQEAALAEIIGNGLRESYYPMDAQGKAVQWHFLQPMWKVATEIGKWEYELPPEVVTVFAPITYTSSFFGAAPIQLVSEPEIRKKRQFDADDVTAKPLLAATEQLPPAADVGTRYKLLLWPTPDAVVELQFQVALQPAPLGPYNPTPVGGDRFGGVIRAACLAEAEKMFNDGQIAKQQDFLRALATAIAHERAQDPDYLHRDNEYGSDNAWTERRAFRRYGTVNFEGWD